MWMQLQLQLLLHKIDTFLCDHYLLALKCQKCDLGTTFGVVWSALSAFTFPLTFSLFFEMCSSSSPSSEAASSAAFGLKTSPTVGLRPTNVSVRRMSEGGPRPLLVLLLPPLSSPRLGAQRRMVDSRHHLGQVREIFKSLNCKWFLLHHLMELSAGFL